MSRHRLSALALAALVAACTTVVENPVTGRPERTVMDPRAEATEGRRVHEQVLAEYGALRDPRLQAYVNEIGQRLARSSHRAELPWTFTVLDSPEINAFAVPGGYVYVTRGLMAYMESEADLAGVIGHEIGHVTARHSAQRATRAQTAGLGALLGAVLGAVLESRGVGGAGELGARLSQSVAAGYIAHYSREQELQADQLGAEYLARAGYNPRNMVDVIEVLRNQERFAADLARAEGRAPREQHWLSSHPSNEQRLREIQDAAARRQGSWGDDRREAYLRTIDGMTFGESREQGVTRGRHFFHEPLGFAITAPPGWKIQNAANALTIAAAQGSVGLVLQPVPANAGASHDEIVRNAVQPDSVRAERRRLNGLAATHYSGTRRTPQGASVPFALTLVDGPGGHRYALVYAFTEPAALMQAQRELQAVEGSFRPLSPEERSLARPWTLRVARMPAGGFAELARRSPLPNAEQQLRLLNGHYGGGQPPVGSLVKVVE